jgi:hypothetical protein
VEGNTSGENNAASSTMTPIHLFDFTDESATTLNATVSSTNNASKANVVKNNRARKRRAVTLRRK